MISRYMRGLLFPYSVSTGNSQDLQIRVWHSTTLLLYRICLFGTGGQGTDVPMGYNRRKNYG